MTDTKSATLTDVITELQLLRLDIRQRTVSNPQQYYGLVQTDPAPTDPIVNRPVIRGHN